MIVQLLPFVDEQARFFNLYGPAEITIVATRYEIRREELSENVTMPIGYPLDGYCIHLLDEYRQAVVPGQLGEMFVGGVGVFAGYYGRNDLTSQVLVEIEHDECYATGDLGRLDAVSGELYFVGRRDYQVKLRGQRIEVGEIEETIVKGSTLVTGCIVMKMVHHEDEHLVCYIEAPSDKFKEDDLRNQCRSSLPHHMIPSKFIILDHFPLTVNGKVNRKLLPSPDFSSITRESDDNITPQNDMEKRVQSLWCQVLDEEHIPINRSFFALHGSSLLFMKLYNHYQIEFGRVPDVVTCLRQATIRDHARLLLETIASTNANEYQAWSSLKINQGKLTTLFYNISKLVLFFSGSIIRSITHRS
jgi:AMP-binding enzyme/AMP-binding enzyme C-terminal domain